MNSQNLVIGDPATDTSNEYSEKPDESYLPSDESDQNVMQDADGHMDLPTATIAIQDEQNQQTQAAHNPLSQQINWEEYMTPLDAEYPEDEEWELDRQLRILREQEEEERAGSHGRLTAPQHEVRRRQKQPSRTEANQVVETSQLRAKQMLLVEKQLELHDMMIGTEKIKQEEAKERLKMTTAQRKLAELDLQAKEMTQ